MLLLPTIYFAIHSLTLLFNIPSTDNISDQNPIFVAANQVYKHCGDACTDVIVMPQFLKVVVAVRQHILGVVGNVIHSEP